MIRYLKKLFKQDVSEEDEDIKILLQSIQYVIEPVFSDDTTYLEYNFNFPKHYTTIIIKKKMEGEEDGSAA